VRPALALGGLVASQQLAEEELDLLGRGRGEDDLPPSALVGDDQVLVGLQVAAVAIGVVEEQPVQVQDEGNAQLLV